MDVEWDQNKEASKMGNAEEYIVYLNQAEKLLLMTPNSEAIQFTLQPSSFEIFSFVPIKKLHSDLKFAPIGLMNMFNCGGTITEVDYGESWEKIFARIKVKGVGNLLVYSSGKPKSSLLNGVEVGLEWSGDGKLTVNLPWKEETGGVSDLLFAY